MDLPPGRETHLNFNFWCFVFSTFSQLKFDIGQTFGTIQKLTITGVHSNYTNFVDQIQLVWLQIYT